MSLLVIGANGRLGRQVVTHFEAAGHQVWRTSHREPADFHLDLAEPVGRWATALPSCITHAWVCSGTGQPEVCHREPQSTRLLNVDHTVDLLGGLLDRGIKPIICSTAEVFAGRRGSYREDDQTGPGTEFGRQKKDLETWLLAQGRPCLVVRLTQLYTTDAPDTSPVGALLASLLAGETVAAADDEVLCPTFVGDIPGAVERLTRAGANGVYHVANPTTWTAYALALLLANRLGRARLVERTSLREQLGAGHRLPNTSLDVRRVLATGFRFSALEERLPAILEANCAPAAA
ncbi:MAG: sugar nucleotide-binding protein [Armatimonadetes bacterium]|nr:sugar nucleotide-binding protein [Armatimonadota bacterium]